MSRRLVKLAVPVLLAVILVSSSAEWLHAQDAEAVKFPVRPINFVVPLPAGGPTDLVARLIAKEAEKYLGQPIVIVNKVGGGSTIGIASVAKAKPDGYTIGLAAHSGIFLIPYLEKVPYDPIKDLEFISQFSGIIMAVGVKGDSPFKNFKDLLDHARKNPKKATYGTAGANTLQNLIIEEIGKKEQVEFTHVPYRGTQEWEVALMGGHITFGVGQLSSALTDSGLIRPLITLSEDRPVEFPQVPSLKDFKYDIPSPMFLALIGPKGLPDLISRKIEDAFAKAAKEPAFVKGMKENIRLPIVLRNSKEVNAYVKRNYEVIGKLLKEKGLVK